MKPTNLTELYTFSTEAPGKNWPSIIRDHHCRYLDRKCIKIRKSSPYITIGTCSVKYQASDVIICPHRLLENRKIFLDCIHLLTMHEPGNDLHIIGEIEIPGGSIDYFLVSVHRGKVVDFVGIELQTLDTTGTVWPARQRFLNSVGIATEEPGNKPFGMNWKMTAKTILVQLHHKIKTFEHLNKHLVLIVQDHLLGYMRKEFSFGHVSHSARLGDSMHFHSYQLAQNVNKNHSLQLVERVSTDSSGIATCLGLQAEAIVEYEVIISKLEKKMSEHTRISI